MRFKGIFSYGLAVDAKGRVIANLDISGPPAFGRALQALVRVDPKTDERALITDFGNAVQGEVCSFDPDNQVYCFIAGLTLQHAKKIFVATQQDAIAKIFRVNTATGERILVTDFSNPAQGADGGAFVGFGGPLAVEASGQLLAVDDSNRLLRIDPTTGNRTVLSDFGNRAQGPRGTSLHSVGLEGSGNILVAALNIDGTNNLLFRVAPKTGRRVVLSNSKKSAQGPALNAPTSLAVVPAKLTPRNTE